MWYIYDEETGMDYHETEKEASDAAKDALESYRDDVADNGWFEDTNDISWGKVNEKVEKIKEYPAPKDSDYDTYVEFDLVKEE